MFFRFPESYKLERIVMVNQRTITLKTAKSIQSGKVFIIHYDDETIEVLRFRPVGTVVASCLRQYSTSEKALKL
jgi:hypothetical protein